MLLRGQKVYNPPERMPQDIFLIGAGQTRFCEQWDMSLRDLIEASVTAAITDAKLSAIDIDMVIVANMIGDAVADQAHLGALAASLLPHRPPALRVEAACASGSVAVHTACSLLRSGDVETVLVVGAEKMTDVPNEVVSRALMGASDAEKDAAAGLTFPGIFGLVAQRYQHDYDLTREQLSLVSAQHHQHAVTNPNAQFQKAIPAEMISESPLVADPLRLLDCSPISDGAAACILSVKHRSPFRIAASQLSTDTLSLADRPTLTSFSATKEAAQKAFREADITRDDISHIELHDCFSIAALISLEDLGFAEPGNGISFYEQPDPNLTINQSGGLKACGHPVAATGVKQLIDLRRELRASGEQFGLAHNFGGAGATCCVHLLEHAA